MLSLMIFWFSITAIVLTALSLALLVLLAPGKRPRWFVWFLVHLNSYLIWLIFQSFLFFSTELMGTVSRDLFLFGKLSHSLLSLIIIFAYPPFITGLCAETLPATLKIALLASPFLVTMLMILTLIFSTLALVIALNGIYNGILMVLSLYGFMKLRRKPSLGLKGVMKFYLLVVSWLYLIMVLVLPLFFIIPRNLYPQTSMLFTALFCLIWSLIMIRALIRRFREDPSQEEIPEWLIADYRISPRETDVLKKLAEGKTNKIIADELFISQRTAETHIGRIYKKLDVSSRAELLRFLHRQSGALP